MYPPKDIEPNLRKVNARELKEYGMKPLIQAVIIISLITNQYSLYCQHISKVRSTYVLNKIKLNKHLNNSEKVKGTVLIFISLDCPISQKYMSVLDKIKVLYGDSSVSFISVIPGKAQKSDIQSFKKDYASSLPFLIDRRKKLSKKLKATVTPEAFLLDHNCHIVFHGAIDNWFYSLGKNRPTATENYLINAINSLLKEEVIMNEFIQPVGCFIEYP